MYKPHHKFVKYQVFKRSVYRHGRWVTSTGSALSTHEQTPSTLHRLLDYTSRSELADSNSQVSVSSLTGGAVDNREGSLVFPVRKEDAEPLLCFVTNPSLSASASLGDKVVSLNFSSFFLSSTFRNSNGITDKAAKAIVDPENLPIICRKTSFKICLFLFLLKLEVLCRKRHTLRKLKEVVRQSQDSKQSFNYFLEWYRGFSWRIWCARPHQVDHILNNDHYTSTAKGLTCYMIGDFVVTKDVVHQTCKINKLYQNYIFQSVWREYM